MAGAVDLRLIRRSDGTPARGTGSRCVAMTAPLGRLSWPTLSVVRVAESLCRPELAANRRGQEVACQRDLKPALDICRALWAPVSVRPIPMVIRMFA
jgi:hypothetical protein